eukprot:CAMPEP_0168523360 /NCGR_PEP_ID=MMETSP0405-20121227/9939_1 /TAXON_ID=498012 /ORGANISM="Trichosphaerium sp, Strain Am-I-7 wt" /LENGTH=778 /DNA_ID=CAMNT_0008545223 /DNA_START=482 /DNA_END=2818 /DNA_ORIENTATION=+
MTLRGHFLRLKILSVIKQLKEVHKAESKLGTQIAVFEEALSIDGDHTIFITSDDQEVGELVTVIEGLEEKVLDLSEENAALKRRLDALTRPKIKQVSKRGLLVGKASGSVPKMKLSPVNSTEPKKPIIDDSDEETIAIIQSEMSISDMSHSDYEMSCADFSDSEEDDTGMLVPPVKAVKRKSKEIKESKQDNAVDKEQPKTTPKKSQYRQKELEKPSLPDEPSSQEIEKEPEKPKENEEKSELTEDTPPAPPTETSAPPPPPPPDASVPPPPPPPGSANTAPAVPPKEKKNPPVKMRNVMWMKIKDSNIKGTVWDDLDDDKIELDVDSLHTLFGVSKPKIAPKSPEAPKTVPTAQKANPKPMPKKRKKSISELIDMRRANNIQIMLRGLKMDPENIEKALSEFNTTLLDVEKLEAIKDNLPTPEERQNLLEFDGNKDKLGPAEQFLLQLTNIKRCGPRVNSMLYQLSFEDKVESVKRDMTELGDALKAIKTSTALATTLETVLAVGNYMNGQGSRGGCYGFKLSSLAKLDDVRSTTDGGMTLANFIVKMLTEKNILDKLQEELNPVKSAVRIDLNECVKKVNRLKVGNDMIGNELKNQETDQKFKDALEVFHTRTQKKVNRVVKKVQTLKETLEELLKKYAEPANTTSETFFTVFTDMLTMLLRARDANERRKLLKKKRSERRSMLIEKRLLRKIGNNTGGNMTSTSVPPKDSGDSDDAKGWLDDAISMMHSGTFAQNSRGYSPPPDGPGIRSVPDNIKKRSLRLRKRLLVKRQAQVF